MSRAVRGVASAGRVRAASGCGRFLPTIAAGGGRAATRRGAGAWSNARMRAARARWGCGSCCARLRVAGADPRQICRMPAGQAPARDRHARRGAVRAGDLERSPARLDAQQRVARCGRAGRGCRCERFRVVTRYIWRATRSGSLTHRACATRPRTWRASGGSSRALPRAGRLWRAAAAHARRSCRCDRAERARSASRR